MKHLYLIGGSMGVGKTTICQRLKVCLPQSVFLDGDWCWDMHPFTVNGETKQMVVDNICYLLNNFLRCSACDHVVFCWVMHEQAIIDNILARLDTTGCAIHLISLVCTPDALRERLSRDVAAGIRQPDVITRSLARLPLYAALDTVKIDVSAITPDEAAAQIAGLAAAGLSVKFEI